MTTTHSTPRMDVSTGRSPLRTAAMIVGGTFLLIGVLGFVPGVVTDFSSMTFAGHESGAKLLGLFQVSILHNAVHIAFGVAGLLAARAAASARTFLIVGGLVYLALWLYGMFIAADTTANFVPVNDADDWLHFGLGSVMVALGTLLGRD